MKVTIKIDGPVSIFKFTRSLTENISRILFFIFISGMGLLIISFSFAAPHEQLLIIVMLLATGGFIIAIGLVFLYVTKLSDIVVDQDNKTVTIDKNTLHVSDLSSVIISRRYTIVGGGKNRRQAVAWKIAIEDPEGKEHTIYRYTGNGNTFNCPWIDETAETIAEILQVTLEDRTGTETVIRHPGETDTSYIDLLKEKGLDSGDIARPSIPLELQDRLSLEMTDSGYVLFSLHRPFSLVSVIKAIVGSILFLLGVLFNIGVVLFGFKIVLAALTEFDDSLVTAGPVMLVLWYITIALAAVSMYIIFSLTTFYFGIILLTNLKRTTFVDFTREYPIKNISLREKGMFLTRNRGAIPFDAVEKLIRVRKWSEKYTVEFVGDIKRVQLPGNYKIEEAELLEDLITHILVQVGI